MQACTACPAGKTTTSTGASSVDDCEECPAGTEAQPQADGRITCVACTENKVSVAGGPCEFCPEGLVYMGPGNDKNVNCKLCKACNPHEYRTECADGLEERCTACESCPDGEQRVNCRHDAGFNDAEGECVKSEFLSYTPFCPTTTTFQDTEGSDVQVSVGLGGFSYNELFGVPDSSYVADFQCRTECLATDEDTSFCGGPFACGTRACSASFARDGEVDFRKPRGCPVTVDKAGDTDAAKLWKIKQTCVDCSVCGQVPPVGLGDLPFAADWGRGCAQECTRLVCEIGEIYDFTDSTCKRCEQLRSKRLCPETVQDTLRTSDVSGNDVLLRRNGCQEKPGAFDYEERKFYQDTVASPNPEYGDCEECAGPADCAANEYAATCESCERCIPHGLIEMQQRTWSDVDGNGEILFCQMPECSSGLTGVYGDGRVCTDRCTPLEDVQCEDDERVVPCMLPHNVRCRKRWPAHELPRVHRGVAASSADLLNDASEFASFENALVEVQEEPKHRHVCVWNAMDIRDSVARPGGVSRTWRKPADSIDFVYDKTGTKFCAPITHDNLNLSDVSAVEWKRDPLLQDYPLLPLQNTFASTSQYALTNTSASAVAYRRADEIANAESLWMQNAKYYDYVDIPTAPDGLSGDLFLSLDLKQAVRADTAVQFSNDFRTITHPLSMLVTAWVAGLSPKELGMTAALQAETREGVPLSADAAWIDMSLATFSTPDADCSDWSAFDQEMSEMSVTAGEPRRFAKMFKFMSEAEVRDNSCVDVINWYDYNSDDCSYYAQNLDLCTDATSANADGSVHADEACCVCGGGVRGLPSDYVNPVNLLADIWVSTTCAACRVSTILDPWDDHLFVGDGAVGAENVLTYRSGYHDVAWHGGVLQVLSAFTEGGVGYDVVTVGERRITLLEVSTGLTQRLDQNIVDAEQMIQHVAIMPAPAGGAQSLMIQVVDARGRQSTVMYPSTQNLAFQSPISYDRRLAFCARGHEHMWVVQQVNGVFALYLQSDPAASALRLEDRRKQGATKLYGADIELGVVTLATCSISPSAETLDSQTSVVVVPVHNNNTRTLTFRVSNANFTGDDSLTIETPAFPACKPGIAWVDDVHFFFGIPCQKLLWRGRSAADALTLTPISHEQANFLHTAYFILDGRTWLRVGVHTSDDVADLTAVSLQSQKCAHGFEALKRSPSRANAVLKSTALCGSFCVHDPTCKAYEYLADRGTQCWIYTDDVHWNVPVADDGAGVDVCKKSEPSTAAVTRLLQPSNQLIYITMARNVQRIQQVVGFRKMSSVADSFTGLLWLPGNMHVPADGMADTLNVDITEAGTSVDLHFARRSSWEYNDTRHLTLNDVVQAQSVAEQELRVPMFVKEDDTSVECKLRIQFVWESFNSDYLIPQLQNLGVDIFVVLQTAPNVFSINRGEFDDGTGKERIKWYDHNVADADQTPVVTGHLDVPYGQSVRFLFCDVGLSALALRAYLDGFEYISAVRGLAHYASNGASGAEAWRRWGRWQRLAVVLPKSLTWKAALVRLAVERTPDAELGSSWPETGCETQLVVGVDAFSALPLLTETPAHKIGDFVFVAALRLQGTHVFDASVQRGSGTTDWKRVHARALAPRAPMFASAASVIRVRVRFLDHFTRSPIPPVADVGLNKLGCDIDLGGGGDGDTVHDSCFLELPHDTIYDGRLVLAFEFVPRDAATQQGLIDLLAVNPQNGEVFATPAPPHSSLVECPAADEFWDVDSSVCRPCDVGQTDCQPGEYIPGCTALEVDESNAKLTTCVACTNAPSGQTSPTHFTWDSNSDNGRACSYTCATDRFKDADGMCQPCTTPTCERGEEVVACTREVDARCAPCVPHVEHGVFMQNEDFIDTTHACLASDECGSCFSQCANGYYRLKTSVTNPVDGASSDITPCVPCKSLQDAQALLEQTRMDDVLGTFYRFQACTGITDLIAEQCPVVANGDAIGDATTIGGACVYKCDPGYRVASATSTTQTVTAYSDAADNTAFETAMETNKASEAFGTFSVTFEEKTCVACASPYTDSSSFVWLNTELECQYECAAGYMLWNQQCRQCAARTCSLGQYVSGANCDSCTNCDDPMTDATLWKWTGAGAVVGDAKSCPWECNDGYFRSGMECVLHTPQPASCGDNFFWQAGTPEFDGACLPCASCEGMSEVSSCTATANAECTPCAVAITDGEEYVGTACSVQCRAGYIRDAQAGGSGECEACGGFECAPGSHLAAAPLHCADCEACGTPKPANSKWIFRCEYACNAGYVLAQVVIPAVDSDASDTTEFVCQADQSGSIEVTKSRVAEIRKIICSSKEYLDDNFVCQPCVVATPSAEQEDVTWSWVGRGCRWECLADRLRYVDRLGNVHCLLWGDYQSVIVTRSDAWGKRFARVQYVVPHLNTWELSVFVLVLSVAMGVQFLA